MEEKLKLLAQIPFLKDLTQGELLEFAKEFRWEIYPQDTLVLEKDQKPLAITIIKEGKCDVEGVVFGELEVVTGKPSSKTVTCIEETKVLMIEAQDFARLLWRWPKIYRTIIEQLSHDLQEVSQLLTEKNYKEVLRSAIELTQYKEKFYGIWGSVKTTKEIEKMLKEISEAQGHLLIYGERGTGRQMVAWYAHQHLFGENAPFVVLDGQRFDGHWDVLLRDGSEKEDNLPYLSIFDLAAGGTLFIREIHQISLENQVRLAEAIGKYKNKCFVIGSIQDEENNASEILPTLKECFGHVYSITPLRKRKRDIPIIAQGILERLAQKHQRPVPKLTPEATQLLLSHNYRQGNVTELIQVMERAFFLVEEEEVGLEQIFFGPTAEKIGSKINLLQWENIRNFVMKKKLLNVLQWLSAVSLIFIIGGLLFFPQLSITMKAFILIWGLWWPALAIFSPILGRIWCTFCPFSKIMEFVQDRYHPKRPLPPIFIKYDYLVVSFLFAMIFWLEVFTGMRANIFYTALLLLTIQILAIIISVLYPRHAWCKHFCPLGGFVGTASIGSILEVRADPAVCLNKCTTFDCYVGRDGVKGCPMSQHLPYLDNNLDCKLCFRCVHNCQHNNVQVNLRVAAREVWHLNRVNQGYTVFIGMLLGIIFPMLYFEPLHGIWPKDIWNFWFTISYFGGAVFGGALGWLVSRPFKTKSASKRVKLTFAFVHIVFACHIVYQMGFIPGLDLFSIGLGWNTSSGLISNFFPATQVASVIAIMIGFLLTIIAITVIIYKHRRDNKKPRIS
ncbi:MAG: sigma 54-interacting transcriptional regulator [Desulfitobacterium sp.]|nr:sigma 54-interacting transcriptional regulator [Desulfitobacterium sp.]